MALAGIGALGNALKARSQLALEGTRLEDPESGEVIDAEHCPLMRKALLAHLSSSCSSPSGRWQASSQ